MASVPCVSSVEKYTLSTMNISVMIVAVLAICRNLASLMSWSGAETTKALAKTIANL